MSRGDRFKPLFTWRSAICDSDLAPTTRHVALTLALYMNERGGSARPGPTLLAKDTGYHVSTVKEHLGILTREGWLKVVERGGIKGEKKRANEYEATIPEDPPEDGEPVVVDDPSSSPTGGPECAHPSSSPRPPVPEDDPMSPGSSPGSQPPPNPPQAGGDEGPEFVLEALKSALGAGIQTRSSLRMFARAANDLAQAGVTAEDVWTGVAEFRERWPMVTCTPNSLAKNWPILTGQEPTAPAAGARYELRCSACDRTPIECECSDSEWRQVPVEEDA